MAAQSGHPLGRYSGVTRALGRLARTLHAISPPAWQEARQRLYAGVIRDFDDRTEYYARYQGLGTTVGRAVNDRYLRANRIESGVRNYDESERLYLAYARQAGGTIIPD